uniref:Reverse transcriptase domain-containing protein n=1 Tax=Aegilops tauschii subsp. strangulata TaxID=200361 RepID=A0A453DDL0_AEGTS
VLETRSQKQARDHLLATMDLALKAYLDKMSDEAAARANKQEGDNSAILQALATQTARIDALVTWKPELEARFAQLELSVAALQAASPSTAPSTGSPPHATPLIIARETHGQPSHGAPLHPGGSPTVTPESPAASPVTDIRAVVLIQRPPDLDTACSLALLQEEVADGEAAMRTSFNRMPLSLFASTSNTVAVTLQRPSTPATIAEDHRGTEAARAPTDNSKIAALRSFRRARGLCFKCGERWGKDHTCPTTVQMHVVEELLELFATEEVLDENNRESSELNEDNLCTISKQAVDGSTGPGVMQLHAWIQGEEMSLLVDSGSSSSFVDRHLAAKLNGVCKLPKVCRVKVADGVVLICDSFIPQCQWTSQGDEFTTDFKLLSLGAYDAILGMDWLRKHSPMHIDWEAQQMSVTAEGGLIELQAVARDHLLI